MGVVDIILVIVTITMRWLHSLLEELIVAVEG